MENSIVDPGSSFIAYPGSIRWLSAPRAMQPSELSLNLPSAVAPPGGRILAHM